MASKLTKIYANFETQLAVKLAVGAVTGSLSNVVTKDGVTIATGKYTMVFNLGESNEEHLKFDLDSGTKAMTNIVSVKRDGTEVTGAQQEHRVGAVGKITNFVNLKAITDILNGTDTLDGSSPINYDAEPTISDRKQVPHAGYVQDILSGAVGTANDQSSGTTKVTKNQGTKPKARAVYAREQSTPDKTLIVESLRVVFLDKIVSYTGGNTPNFIDPGFGGDLAINTNPSNTETFVLTVDGTAITFTAVTSIGATPGNFLIGGSAAVTRANLAALINNPTVTNANQVALTGAQLTACQKVNCTDDLALNLFVRATNPAVATFSAVENFAGAGNTWTPNTTKNRYDLVVIDNAGTLQIRKGTEAVSPTVPTPTLNDIPVCLVLNRCGMTTVRDYDVAGHGYITDWYDLTAYRNDLVTQSQVINFGGTGADGALAVSSGTTNIDLGGAAIVVKNYTSIAITGTGAIAFTNPHANGTIIILKSQGNVTVTSSASPAIDLRGVGAQGGAAGNGNRAPGGGGGAAGSAGNNSYALDDLNHYGNGGAGGGGSPSSGGATGSAYSNLFLFTDSVAKLARKGYFITPGAGGGGGGGGNKAINDSNGSTGGGHGGAGGRGAGAMVIECNGAWNFTGNINYSGQAGSNGNNSVPGGWNGCIGEGGAGGGGAEGMFVAIYRTLTANSGTFTGGGGAGGVGATSTAGSGSGGGGGAGGGGAAQRGAGGAGGNASTNSAGSVGNAGAASSGAGGGGGGGAGNNGAGLAGGGSGAGGSTNTNNAVVFAYTAI